MTTKQSRDPLRHFRRPGRVKRACNVCGLSPCDCDRRQFLDDGDEPPPERIDRETARRELGLDL